MIALCRNQQPFSCVSVPLFAPVVRSPPRNTAARSCGIYIYIYIHYLFYFYLKITFFLIGVHTIENFTHAKVVVAPLVSYATKTSTMGIIGQPPDRFGVLLTRAECGLILVSCNTVTHTTPIYQDWKRWIENNNLVIPESLIDKRINETTPAMKPEATTPINPTANEPQDEASDEMTKDNNITKDNDNDFDEVSASQLKRNNAIRKKGRTSREDSSEEEDAKEYTFTEDMVMVPPKPKTAINPETPDLEKKKKKKNMKMKILKKDTDENKKRKTINVDKEETPPTTEEKIPKKKQNRKLDLAFDVV